MLASIVLGLACMGCVDDTSPTLAVPTAGVPLLLGTVECTVDRLRASVVCSESHRTRQDGPSLALLSGSAIKMRSANFVADTISEIWSFDATAENLLTYAVGTPDGQTKTGLKVFFETGPTARYRSPGDTGTVTVRNPDGYQNFTGPQQPYHLYDTILAPQAVTSPKRWEFNVPRTVSGYSFTVRVFTTTPHESRVPLQPPAAEPAWFRDPSNSIRCFGNSTAMCLKGVVRVMFRALASQEERQSAVDMVKGSVVGGGDGFYYVSVPGNGTLANLEGHIRNLERLPQVQAALRYITYGAIEVSFATPYDTTGWRSWQLNPDPAHYGGPA